MSYVAEKSVETAKAWVGYHEGSNNSNVFSPWQGLDDNNPWCASFTCYCSVEGGGYRFPANNTFGYKGEAYTPTTKQRAQEEGLWRDKWWRARAGDHVLFDWGNNGLIDHVELVIYDDGTSILTIGGNTSNAVLYRKRDRAFVAGFYALSDSPQVEVPPPPPPKVRPQMDPARSLRARLRHPEGLGWWDGYEGGRVDWLPNNSDDIRIGGMISPADRLHFGDRTLARLKPRPYTSKDGTKRHGYTITASDGAEYVPEAQH